MWKAVRNEGKLSGHVNRGWWLYWNWSHARKMLHNCTSAYLDHARWWLRTVRLPIWQQLNGRLRLWWGFERFNDGSTMNLNYETRRNFRNNLNYSIAGMKCVRSLRWFNNMHSYVCDELFKVKMTNSYHPYRSFNIEKNGFLDSFKFGPRSQDVWNLCFVRNNVSSMSMTRRPQWC